MSDFIGLRHIGLPAKNLAKMAEFYRDVLGMTITRENSADAPYGASVFLARHGEINTGSNAAAGDDVTVPDNASGVRDRTEERENSHQAQWQAARFPSSRPAARRFHRSIASCRAL
jgi:catechol 2,3-dioxygenase-like lactoylglutathione lyase family enzyme